MMMLVLCVIRHIAPFGDNTFLYLDMKRQYVDFYSYYKSVFTGKNDFIYTFGSALGQSMMGFTSYYLTSPLLIPFIFIDKAQLPAAVTFLCITKIALSGLTSNIYLRLHFHRECSRASVLFSTSFAFSAYMLANMCNVMWLDPIIMLPLILLGLDRITECRKGIPFLYILSLSVSFFTNYYISYMIAIFTVIYFICMMFIRPRDHRRYVAGCLTYVISSLTAVLLVSFILIPNVIALRSSTKNSLRAGVKITLTDQNPLDIMTKLLSLSFDNDQIMNGLPHLFCGIMVLLLFMMFFTSTGISGFQKMRAALMTVILVTSSSIAGMDIVWHAGTEPLGYRYRYAFLLVFVIVSCAYETFEDLGNNVKECGSSSNMARYIIPCVLALLLAVYALYSGETFFDKKKLVINVFLIVSETVLIFWYSKGRQQVPPDKMHIGSSAVAAITCIAAIQSLDLLANAYVIYGTESDQQMTVSEYTRYLTATEGAVSAINDAEKGNSMFRIENTSPRSENDSMMFDYNGMTHYDSTNSARSINDIKRMGYEVNQVFCEYDTGNTDLADDLLGIRYIISPKRMTDDSMSTFDPQKIGGDAPKYLDIIKRRTSLTMAVSFDEGNYSGFSDDPFSIQTSIIDGLCGYSAGILKKTDSVISESNENVPVPSDGADHAHGMYVTPGKTMNIRVMHYDVTPSIDGDVYFYLTEPNDRPQNIEIMCDGVSLGSYANDSSWSVVCLGAHKAGVPFRFDVRLCDDEAQPGEAHFVTEDRKAAKAAYHSLESDFDDIEEVSSSHLKVTVPNGKHGSSIYLSVPYDKEWHAKLDGKDLEISDYYGFVRVDLGKSGIHSNHGDTDNRDTDHSETYHSKKDHSETDNSETDNSEANHGQIVDMRYIPDGFEAGIIISVLTLAALVSLAAFKMQKHIIKT